MQAYADGSFKLVGKNSSFDFNTVTGEMNLEVTNLKISSKVVATKDDVAEVENKVTTLLRIESSKGTALRMMTRRLFYPLFYIMEMIKLRILLP